MSITRKLGEKTICGRALENDIRPTFSSANSCLNRLMLTFFADRTEEYSFDKEEYLALLSQVPIL